MKTSELTGRLLDYWVAKAEGLDPVMRGPAMPMVLATDAQRVAAQSKWVTVKCYSADWSYGGPIVEREWRPITAWLFVEIGPDWRDDIDGTDGDVLRWFMRGFVASKFGDEVPDEVPA